jgi:hypothetical protein
VGEFLEGLFPYAVVNASVEKSKRYLSSDASLKEYLLAAEANTNFVHSSNEFAMLACDAIDRLFIKAAHHLNETTEVIPSWFLFRSHSAFRCAFRLASAGQLPESYMITRGCLEASQYAFHVFVNKGAGEIWVKRDSSKSAARAVVQEFKKAIFSLKAVDPQIGKISSDLYELTIKMGAHPNPDSILTNMTSYSKNNTSSYSINYMSDDSVAISLAFKTIAQAGITSLKTFRHVFKTRFDLVGLSLEIDRLSDDL